MYVCATCFVCALFATCLRLADAVEELLLLCVGPEDLVEHEGVLPVVVAGVVQRQLHIYSGTRYRGAVSRGDWVGGGHW